MAEGKASKAVDNSGVKHIDAYDLGDALGLGEEGMDQGRAST